MKKPMIWAHRGASSVLAENTMPAFEMAIQQKADGIELDVQRTADQELVVIHDERIDRTTGEPGWVYEKNYEFLRKLNAAAFKQDIAPAGIPKLKEVLDLIKSTNLILNIEIKNGLIQMPGVEKQLWDLVSSFEIQDRIVFSSFNHYSLRLLLDYAPEANCGLLYQCGLIDPWIYATRVGANALHPHWANLQIPDLVKNSQEKGIKVNTWTVNGKRQIMQAVQAGVNAIITDQPDKALDILSQI